MIRPYRDSKLTLLLQSSMTSGLVIMIAALSPGSACYQVSIAGGGGGGAPVEMAVGRGGGSGLCCCPAPTQFGRRGVWLQGHSHHYWNFVL